MATRFQDSVTPTATTDGLEPKRDKHRIEGEELRNTKEVQSDQLKAGTIN